MDEDFKRGEAKEKLKNIEEDVSEMKGDLKAIDVKIDDVEKASHDAADLAKIAVIKADTIERKNDDRHAENTKNLESIKETVERLAKDQNDTKMRMYIIAAGIGLSSGGAAPLITKLFM